MNRVKVNNAQVVQGAIDERPIQQYIFKEGLLIR